MAHNVSPNNAVPHSTLFYLMSAAWSDHYWGFTELLHRLSNEGASLLGVLCAAQFIGAMLIAVLKMLCDDVDDVL